MGHVCKFFAPLDARYPLETAVTQPAGVFVDAQACDTKDGLGVNLLVVNRGSKPVATGLVLPPGYRTERVECLYAPDRLSRTTLAKSDVQVEQRAAGGSDAMTLRPVSVTRVYLKRG